MVRSAITICLVPEARLGPFVFHGGLEEGCARAAEHGFDGVEIFASSAEDLSAREIRQTLQRHGLSLAALGTGAGWLTQRLSLTSPDPLVRRRAIDFIGAMIDLAGGFASPAIIGSMQGSHGEGVSREQALDWLGEALEQLGPRAHAAGGPLLMEPLNRYESNLCNRLDQTCSFLSTLRTRNIKVLCDLFHMNIEEVDLAAALRGAGNLVGHVHFADSNRRAAGMGHTALAPVAEALRDIGFAGYVSAEVLPLPDAESAAAQTITSFHRYFGEPPL